MNFSEQKLLHINLTIRGRANQSFPAILVPNKSLYFASTFSASRWEGLRQPSQYLSTQYLQQILRRQCCLMTPRRGTDGVLLCVQLWCLQLYSCTDTQNQRLAETSSHMSLMCTSMNNARELSLYSTFISLDRVKNDRRSFGGTLRQKETRLNIWASISINQH